MVHSPDRGLNLRADIKATLISLQSTMQIGGNWRRCASLASDLALKFEQLAEWEQTNDAPRTRVVEPPPPPQSAAEFVGERFYRARQAQQARQPRRRIRIREEPSPPPANPPELPPP